MRLSIGKIVVDASCLAGQDPEAFRMAVEKEVAALLERGFDPTGVASANALDGGQVDSASGNFTTAVARQVVRALGGDA